MTEYRTYSVKYVEKLEDVYEADKEWADCSGPYEEDILAEEKLIAALAVIKT